MAARPHILDNLTAATRHAAGLTALVADLGPQHPIAIATGFVNLRGLALLAQTITDGRPVRLLLGAVPEPGLGAELVRNRFELALALLTKERDLARFPPSRSAALLSAVDTWLAGSAVEARRYLTQFLHGKAYLFGTPEDGRAALVTSANLTGAGLHTNLELGIVEYSPDRAATALRWFDGLWHQAGDYTDDLRALLFPDPGLVDPQTVYLRALLEFYGDELNGDSPSVAHSAISLAPFQADGYERARQILAAHHGVVYADGVGTGKTEIGLAFIEEYAIRKGQHALVVAPAQLVGNWRERIDLARLPAQVVSFQQLASDEQLAPSAAGARRHLHAAADTYRLVVVDEAHALRNPDTTWYRAMSRLLGGEQKDLVMLTATPVNNGLWDLYHLVLAFARHDRAFAAIGIPSVRELFVRAGANERDPESLDPDVLFPLADAVSVRRDRRFIEANYPDATFADGTPVRFPTPRTRTQRYALDDEHPGLVSAIADGIDALDMARYRPSAYELGGEEDRQEATLSGLLKSAILKRFESCWAACLATLERMIAAHDAFLTVWDAGTVLSASALRAAALAEADETGASGTVTEVLVDDLDRRPITDFRPEYREAVVADRVHLTSMRDRLRELDPSSDPKLALLREILTVLPAEKVAVFATFGETVDYLDRELPELVDGRRRVVVIGGNTDPDARTAALSRFCPETVVRPGYVPPDGEVNLLLATDVLSEGQNLQQAAAVVSYDMPWNPQRVVQRNGRVIRLRSPHAEVHLVTMLPEAGDLETLLRLESTIRRKILAAGVYGMESEVLDDVDSELRSYAERLAAGDPGLLDDEDGTPGAAFAGEELRRLLQRAATEGEVSRLRALPWGIGAAFHQGSGVPSTGSPGVFLACRTSAGQRYWRFVEADGTVVDNEASMLRRIDPGVTQGVDSAEIDLESAWSAAAASIVSEHNLRADPRTAQESIGPNQRFAIDVLRDPAVLLPPGAAAAEEALSVERGPTVRRSLAAIRQLVVAGTLSRDEAARRVVDVVETYGLRAVEDEPPLEPITQDDLGVVCWMAVLPAAP